MTIAIGPCPRVIYSRWCRSASSATLGVDKGDPKPGPDGERGGAQAGARRSRLLADTRHGPSMRRPGRRRPASIRTSGLTRAPSSSNRPMARTGIGREDRAMRLSDTLLVAVRSGSRMAEFFDLRRHRVDREYCRGRCLESSGSSASGTLRIRADTRGQSRRARSWPWSTVTITFQTFAFTTLVKEPASIRDPRRRSSSRARSSDVTCVSGRAEPRRRRRSALML
jgi:hypothetical protein